MTQDLPPNFLCLKATIFHSASLRSRRAALLPFLGIERDCCEDLFFRPCLANAEVLIATGNIGDRLHVLHVGNVGPGKSVKKAEQETETAP